MESKPLTEQVKRMYCQAYNNYAYVSYKDGITSLDQIISLPDLSEDEGNYFRIIRNIWSNAADPTFLPTEHSSTVHDVEVFYVKYENHIREGDIEQSMRFIWLALQHSNFGTSQFQNMLSHVAKTAAHMDDEKMARHAAELLLSHYEFMVKALDYPYTPVGMTKPSMQHEWLPRYDGLVDYLPIQAALKYISESTSSCWTRILEMELEASSLEQRKRPYYKELVSALRQHYARVGDRSNLEFLRAYDEAEE